MSIGGLRNSVRVPIWLGDVAKVLLTLLLFTNVLSSQEKASDAELVGRLIEQFKKQPAGIFANQLADANAVAAIPVLKEAFAAIKVEPSANAWFNDGLTTKGAIASALVRLGVPNGDHWDFLIAQATMVVASDAPYPLKRDAQGRDVPREMSAEFVDWAKARGLNPEAEARNQLGAITRVFHLATTGDIRGLPLLRKLIVSSNRSVQYAAAWGLALLQDKPSIPQIIRACEGAPPELAVWIASALVFLDDPVARRAAERFIKDQRFLELLRANYAAYGPRGVFR